MKEESKILYVLEASWYAMIKFAGKECSREIKSAEKILRKHGRLPEKKSNK